MVARVWRKLGGFASQITLCSACVVGPMMRLLSLCCNIALRLRILLQEIALAVAGNRPIKVGDQALVMEI